jgi:hypothetical protein
VVPHLLTPEQAVQKVITIEKLSKMPATQTKKFSDLEDSIQEAIKLACKALTEDDPGYTYSYHIFWMPILQEHYIKHRPRLKMLVTGSVVQTLDKFHGLE